MQSYVMLMSVYTDRLKSFYSVKLNNIFIYESYFSCQTQQCTKQLAHISLCVTEFIVRTMLQHVSARGAIIR
jgi:hypothetical protein